MMLVELESSKRLSTGRPQDHPGRATNQALVVEWLPGQEGLRLVGEVDLATREVWADVLTTLLGNNAPRRLDLSGLSFVDVHGAAALMDAARRLAPARKLTLYCPPLCLRRTLDLFWSSELSVIVIEDEEA